MRWDQGRSVIDRMLTEHELDRVPPSREHANGLIAQAHKHLLSAAEICAHDAAGGYSLIYDAARADVLRQFNCGDRSIESMALTAMACPLPPRTARVWDIGSDKELSLVGRLGWLCCGADGMTAARGVAIAAGAVGVPPDPPPATLRARRP